MDAIVTKGHPTVTLTRAHNIVVVGGGAGGIAVATSMLARAKGLDIAVIEPADVHDYQPGWTMVGAGVFTPESTHEGRHACQRHLD